MTPVFDAPAQCPIRFHQRSAFQVGGFHHAFLSDWAIVLVQNSKSNGKVLYQEEAGTGKVTRLILSMVLS